MFTTASIKLTTEIDIELEILSVLLKLDERKAQASRRKAKMININVWWIFFLFFWTRDETRRDVFDGNTRAIEIKNERKKTPQPACFMVTTWTLI